MFSSSIFIVVRGSTGDAEIVLKAPVQNRRNSIAATA
jgi:hypothetical protein